MSGFDSNPIDGPSELKLANCSEPSTAPTVTASTVYSISVTDINLVRTVGRQRVTVGPLPATGAEITVQ